MARSRRCAGRARATVSRRHQFEGVVLALGLGEAAHPLLRCPGRVLLGVGLAHRLSQALASDPSGAHFDLPLADRRAQLQRMIDLNEELYPGFRWFLYDGKQTYSISLTIFGPLRVSLFLGKLYIIVNNIDHIRRLTDRFDDLIRLAVVHPHEIRDCLQKLLQRCA